MQEQPTGTVTYLYTDIEGSTYLWEQMPQAMKVSQARHHAILTHSIEAHNGHIFQIRGDAFCATFWTAADGLMAALDAQRALAAEVWNETGPINVRMVVHTGVTDQRSGFHDGPFLNRVGRLLSITYGGQVLIGASTQALVRELLPEDIQLRDMGEHRLRDVILPEHIYQLVAPDLRADFPPLKTQGQRPNNLPAQLTSFIGREDQIDQVEKTLKTTHLLTLLGPGGTGKTRLSLQVASELLDDYPDGAWFVELAPLHEPAFLANTIAAILSIKEVPGQPVLATLIDNLRTKHILLVLDNCEHMVDACAHVADALLRTCPALTLLASSREALAIGGEITYRVPTLSIPQPESLLLAGADPVSVMSQYEAVRLFIDRAVAVRPGYKVTNENAPAIAQICYQLDGIPLAIELAAARIKAMTAAQIAERLDDSFRLLTGGSRAALPRQQTLRALIDWSYDLLTEPEQQVLTRLAVFAGGWVLDAAEAICTGNGIEAFEMLDYLQQLVDKSLIIFEEQPDGARYRMLQTIRQYAHERLVHTGEDAAISRCHLDWYLQLAIEAEPKLQGAEQDVWIKRLEREHDNLRGALEWALAHEPELGLCLAASLGRFWFQRGYYTEGRKWLDATLAKAAPSVTAIRGKALDWGGMMATMQNDFTRCGILSQECLDIYRALQDKRGIAEALVNLGFVDLQLGENERATSRFEESIALKRESGDKALIANAIVDYGVLKLRTGYPEQALEAGREALVTDLEIGNKWGAAHANEVIGRALTLLGDVDAARPYLIDALIFFKERGIKQCLAHCLISSAIVPYKVGQIEEAARIFGATEIYRQLYNSSQNLAYGHLYRQYMDEVRDLLGQERFDKLFAEGHALSFEDAIAYTRSVISSPTSELAAAGEMRGSPGNRAELPRPE